MVKNPNPGAITASKTVKARAIDIMGMEREINDLRQELVELMDARDRDAEKIAVQQEQIEAQDKKIKGLVKNANVLYKTLALTDGKATKKLAKLREENEALKALLKIYI